MLSDVDKGPRKLQLKLQKKSLSSIHTKTFFHNCKDFFNSFLYGQQFLQQFFGKIVVKTFVVCEGLKRAFSRLAVNHTPVYPLAFKILCHM